MDITKKALKSLFPSDWNLLGDLKAVIDALSLSFERLRAFLTTVQDESNPSTAVETLEEWHTQEGIVYDSTLSISKQQDIVNQSYSNAGGQSPDYLNGQLQKVFPDVQLQEVFIEPEFMAGFGMAGLMMASSYPSWVVPTPTDGSYPNFYFRVIGEVDYVSDLSRIQNLLDKIMPVPYEPVYAVTIRNLTPSAMAGLGMAGLMMAGREN